MTITLASASPRRKELLEREGWDFDIIPSGADETTTETTPEKLVCALALKKARSVKSQTQNLVVGADTVVVVDGRVLTKPKTADEARKFFRLLSNRAHEVMTGLAVVGKGREVVEVCISRVEFGDYDNERLEKYIQSGAPFDKAGGYGIQDELIRPWVKSVEGDLDNVIGLPVALLKEILKEKF